MSPPAPRCVAPRRAQPAMPPKTRGRRRTNGTRPLGGGRVGRHRQRPGRSQQALPAPPPTPQPPRCHHHLGVKADEPRARLQFLAPPMEDAPEARCRAVGARVDGVSVPLGPRHLRVQVALTVGRVTEVVLERRPVGDVQHLWGREGSLGRGKRGGRRGVCRVGEGGGWSGGGGRGSGHLSPSTKPNPPP